MPAIIKTNKTPFPAGVVLSISGYRLPDNSLECNGALILRADYPALFIAIGDTYGAGDGATTFQIPDLRGQYIRGEDDGRGVDITDPGRALGSLQGHAAGTPIVGLTMSTSAEGEHTHQVSFAPGGAHNHTLTAFGGAHGGANSLAQGEFSSDRPPSSSDGAHSHTVTISGTATHTHTFTFANTGNETEPVAMLLRSIITT